MVNIAIVVGSTRPGRKALQVADWVFAQTTTRTDATFDILDIAEFDLPLLDEPIPPSQGKYSEDHTRKWAAAIERFDGFVFVTPEYNHGTSGALKNALDFLYAEWNNKAAGFVSYGSAGGARAVEQLRLVMAELQIADVRAQVMLAFATDFEEGTLAPADHQPKAVQTMLDQVVTWSEAMKAVRARHDWLSVS